MITAFMDEATNHKSTGTAVNISATDDPNGTIEKLFDNIIGYNDVKRLFKLSLFSGRTLYIFYWWAHQHRRKLSLC